MRRALEGLPGVLAVEVDLEGDRAQVDYRDGDVRPRQLVEAVEATVVLPGVRRVLEAFGHRH